MLSPFTFCCNLFMRSVSNFNNNTTVFYTDGSFHSSFHSSSIYSPSHQIHIFACPLFYTLPHRLTNLPHILAGKTGASLAKGTFCLHHLSSCRGGHYTSVQSYSDWSPLSYYETFLFWCEWCLPGRHCCIHKTRVLTESLNECQNDLSHLLLSPLSSDLNQSEYLCEILYWEQSPWSIIIKSNDGISLDKWCSLLLYILLFFLPFYHPL